MKLHNLVVPEHRLQKQAASLRGRQSNGGRVGWRSRCHSAGLLQQENHSMRRCRFQPTQATLRFIAQQIKLESLYAGRECLDGGLMPLGPRTGDVVHRAAPLRCIILPSQGAQRAGLWSRATCRGQPRRLSDNRLRPMSVRRLTYRQAKKAAGKFTTRRKFHKWRPRETVGSPGEFILTPSTFVS